MPANQCGKVNWSKKTLSYIMGSLLCATEHHSDPFRAIIENTRSLLIQNRATGRWLVIKWPKILGCYECRYKICLYLIRKGKLQKPPHLSPDFIFLVYITGSVIKLWHRFTFGALLGNVPLGVRYCSSFSLEASISPVVMYMVLASSLSNRPFR